MLTFVVSFVATLDDFLVYMVSDSFSDAEKHGVLLEVVVMNCIYLIYSGVESTVVLKSLMQCLSMFSTY